MNRSIVQLLFAIIWLGLAVLALINDDTNRFLAMLIIANIWIVGSQITSKIEK